MKPGDIIANWTHVRVSLYNTRDSEKIGDTRSGYLEAGNIALILAVTCGPKKEMDTEVMVLTPNGVGWNFIRAFSRCTAA